ncbi:MAG TPA: PP0621 family protein [Candidatus Polarisedimenticolaceae bacterium]|nr:PP0621 family protein [Candidatus Polarisedimenticolaceae bacterium]
MIRRLLWIAIAALVYWLLRRLRRSAVPEARPRPADTPRFEGAMVRDRECQTFLPRARALSVRAEDGEHFFCSTGCKEAFLARSRPLAR